MQRVARTQQLRHLIANKLTLPLTVLRELQEGRSVDPRVVTRAIRDLDAVIACVDAQQTERVNQG